MSSHRCSKTKRVGDSGGTQRCPLRKEARVRRPNLRPTTVSTNRDSVIAGNVPPICTWIRPNYILNIREFRKSDLCSIDCNENQIICVLMKICTYTYRVISICYRNGS